MANNRLDISGKKFNKLLAIEPAGIKNKNILWRFLCDCGNEVIMPGSYAVTGNRKSCGCNKTIKRKSRNDLSERNKLNATHKMYGTREYNSWRSMKYRCLNKESKDYENYGGRGIKICNEWIDSFEQFFIDMGKRPAGCSLDRIDVNGNYEPSNCRWATDEKQGNNRRETIIITYKGETRSLKEWAVYFGIEHKTLAYRIRSGWDIETALTTKSLIKRK